MQVAKRILAVTGVLNSKNLLFMIDSGATNNFLSLAVVEKLGLKVDRACPLKFVRLANGL